MALGGKNLGALIGQLGMDANQWDQALDNMQRGLIEAERRANLTMQRISEAFEQAGRRMEAVGRSLTRRLSAPIVGSLGLAVREFGNFDQAMTQSLAIMDNVSDTMRNQMSRAARDIALETQFSAQQAAESYFFLASAGMDAAQSLEALPRVAKFAQAGQFDMAQATDLLTDAQSALGMTIRDDVVANMENMTRVSDVLVRANTRANATVQQFSEALTNRAGNALRLVNKDIEEGVAVLAAFADQGIKGAEAGTRLDIVMRDLQTRAVNNAEVFQQYGVAVFDSNDNMRNMADIIEDLENALEGQSDARKRSILMEMEFQDRSVASILSLMGMSGAIRDYEKDLRIAGGTTDEVANNQMDTFNRRLGLLWDRVRDLGIEIGEALVPVLDRLIEVVSDVIDNFRAMDDSTTRQIVGYGLLAAAIGPVTLALGKMLRMIGFLLSATFAKIAALTAFVVGLEYVRRNLEAFQKVAADIWAGVANFAIQMVQNQLEAWADFLSWLPGAAGVSVHLVIAHLESLKQEIPDREDGYGFQSFGEFFEDIANDISGYVSDLIDKFWELGAAGSGISENLEPLTQGLTYLEEGWRDLNESINAHNLGRFMQNQLELIETSAEKLPEALRTPAREMIDISDQMEHHIIQAVENMVESFMDGVFQMAFAGGSMADVWRGVLETLADLAIRVGRIAIGAGLAIKGIRESLRSLNPAAAIAAGVALVALGSAVRAALSSAADRAAGGSSGISESFSPSLRSEPVGQRFGNNQQGHVLFEIGRNKLVGVLQQGNAIDSRIGRRVNIG